MGPIQITDQPTNFEPNKSPSCIDLIFPSQPNLMAEFGTLSSLLTQCHHNVTYAKIDLASKLPKPCKQRMCDYKNPDIGNIRKTIFTIN